MTSIEEPSGECQDCPECQALIDMTDELCTALPINDLFPPLISLRVLGYNDPDELRGNGRTEREIRQRFIEKHLYPYLKLGDTSRLFDFIKVMKQSGKCNLLVERLEERIRVRSQGASISAPSANVSAANSIDFSQCDNIVQGFMLLSTRLSKLLKSVDFSLLKRAFHGQNPGGIQLPDGVKAEIKKAKKLDDLLDVLVESKYWNFADLRLINVLVFSSDNQEARLLVDSYKKAFFSKTLSDVLSTCIRKEVLPPDQHREYTCRVSGKISKEPHEVTVADLAEYCTSLETVIMEIHNGSCALQHIEEGCVKMYLIIPIRCSYHAYKSALNNRHKFHSLHLQYLKIESYPVIYDQFTIQPAVLSTLLCLPKPVVSTTAEVIDHYYCFLAVSLKYDVFFQIMSSLQLMSKEDKAHLSVVASEYHKNISLLNSLVVSDSASISRLCSILEDTEGQQDIGHTLVNAIKSIPTDNDMGKELQPVTEYTQQTNNIDFDKEEKFSKLQSEMILATKSVHIRFLNTIVQVTTVLQECDHQVFLEACSKLYAYEDDSKIEPLFPSHYISNITTIQEVLKRLSFLWSWHNCSVLRTLLAACSCHDGLTLLDNFEAQIDDNLPIELFPIPRLSPKMAPSSYSAYTILSIRSEHYHNQQVLLKHTREVATILVEVFGIFHHALQLLAVQLTPLMMYWMVPKSVTTLINKKIHKHVNVLRSVGLSEITAYPSIALFPESNWSLRSFSMLSDHPQDPLVFITSSEDQSKADAKLEQSEIANLESEIDMKSKELKSLKDEHKKLIRQCSQNKIEFGKIERKLSGDIEMLTSSKLEFQAKVEKLERKISDDSAILTKLESELNLKSQEIERIKNEKTLLEQSYWPESHDVKGQSSPDHPTGYQPSLEHSNKQLHTYLPQQSNFPLTIQDLSSTASDVTKEQKREHPIATGISSSQEHSHSHSLSADDQPHPEPVTHDKPHQPLLQRRSGSYTEFSRVERKCSAFLIGSNITGASVPENAAIPRKPLDKSRNPLDGVLKDLHWMNIFMNDREIPVYELMLGNRHAKLEKHNILGAFKFFFSQKDVRQFVIYYSGHGSNGTVNTNNGDWCFETGDGSESKIIYIGLKDILKLWDEMRSQRHADSYEFKDRYLLFIIADSCHSGSWVEEIKDKRQGVTASSVEKYRDVHMIASCQSHEICYYTVANGGDFTRRYITADSSKHNLKPTAAHVAKLASQSVVQGVTFPLYMPLKGLSNYYNATSHKHTPVATNEKQRYRVLLMKYDGERLPIGKGLGIASGWSWMLSGQIFHN